MKMTQNLGLRAQFQVALANENPAIAENNDLANANRVAVTSAVALAFPDTPVILDTFADMDRGYFPRNGLTDRRYNPRMAANVYRNLNSLLGPYSETLALGVTEKVIGGKICTLKSSGYSWMIVLPKTEIALDKIDFPDMNLRGEGKGVFFNLASGQNFGIQWRIKNNRIFLDDKPNGNFRMTAPGLLWFASEKIRFVQKT